MMILRGGRQGALTVPHADNAVIFLMNAKRYDEAVVVLERTRKRRPNDPSV